MSDIVVRFLVANLAIGAAVLVVLALRAPVRAMFGARLTYALWLLVPLAGAASLLPPRVEQIVSVIRAPEVIAQWQGPVGLEPMLETPRQDQPFPGDALQALEPAAAAGGVVSEASGFVMPNPFVLAGIVWFIGMIAMALWQFRRQSRFVSDARVGFAGPAVVGVIKPRIVTPSDFETTFDADEREVILTHERIHIEGNDARINALAALAGCICWFNPLVHLGAYVMRIDQELACDASVVIRHPEARSLYASALLKAQLARAPLPLGCHWPARSEHPLLQRVEMLGRAEPGRGRRIAGVAVLGLLAAASGVTAWAALPPEKRVVERHRIERQDVRVHQDVRVRRDVSAPQDAPAPPSGTIDPHLRIVALQSAQLTIRSADGTVMVQRKFEPGESYEVRTGEGWTVSSKYGPAFEWRAGDEILGLLSPSGGASSIPVDKVMPGLQRIKMQLAPEPQQQVQAPQQTPAPVLWPAGIGGAKPIRIQGKVERIDFTDTRYTVFVRGQSMSLPGLGATPTTALFELNSTSYWGDRDAVNADLKDKTVVVTGSRSGECAPACKVEITSLKLTRPTLLPPITQTPQFSASDVVMRYNAIQPAQIEGVVQRIEFGERMFDAYVQLPALGGVPGAGPVFQVRSEYRFPRADIERQLVGKSVYVAGWRARAKGDTTCSSPCGFYATDIRLGSGEIVSPAGEKLMAPPPAADTRGRQCFKDMFANYGVNNALMRCTDDDQGAPVVDVQAIRHNQVYDMGAPVILKGRIVRADNTGWWIEVTGADPAATPGAQAGTVWFAEGGADKSGDVGRAGTIFGFNARDKSCKPECRMIVTGMEMGPR